MLLVGPHAPLVLSPDQRSFPNGKRRSVWFPPALIMGGEGVEGGLWKRTCFGTETSRL